MVGSGLFELRLALEPSVPRFNPRVVSSKTGGGYRRFPWLMIVRNLYRILSLTLTLGFLASFDIVCYQTWNIWTVVRVFGVIPFLFPPLAGTLTKRLFLAFQPYFSPDRFAL